MADVIAYCVNQRYGGRRGYLEDVFQKFRGLAYNHEDQDEDFKLWGFSMVKPDESAPLPFTGSGIAISVVVEQQVFEVVSDANPKMKRNWRLLRVRDATC